MVMSAENALTDTVMLPPKHTKSFRVNIPFKIPVEIAHCAGIVFNYLSYYISKIQHKLNLFHRYSGIGQR